MTHYLRLLITVLICIGFTFTSPPRAYACSCAESPSPKVARGAATAVFIGKVVTIHVRTGETISSDDPKQIMFQVSQVWKGPIYTKLTVTTARDDASCGFPFEVNKEYLVYASGPETMLQASLCSRTLPISEPQIQDDLKMLGQSTVPNTAPPDSLLPSPILSPTSFAATSATMPTAIAVVQPNRQFQISPLLGMVLFLLILSVCLVIGIIVISSRRK